MMLASAILVRLAVASAAPIPTDWPQVWSELSSVELLDAKSPARADRLRELERIDASLAQEKSARGALLAASFDRLRGNEHALLKWKFTAEWPFDRDESWFAAAVLPIGAQRDQAVVVALGPLENAERDAKLSPSRVRLANDVGVEAANALRYDDALAIQRNLHRRLHEVWSALNLAITDMRAGLVDEGESVLADQIALGTANAEDLAMMWEQRGIASIGAGFETRGRTALGHALMWGSTNALVVLARLDLAAGNDSEARTGFRAALCQNPDSDWARRGFGLSLLPPHTGPLASSTPGW